IFAVTNLQHDCHASECTTRSTVPILQERLESTKRRTIVTHKSTNLWIMNVYSIHNHDVIRKAIPSEL
ncbi:hypothetical protein BC628DRAFT_1288170, partial [Trametes gibbosa]